MSTLQPIQALNLDSVQQQNFIKYYNSLPEKPPTTIRIFDRNDYFTVHGADATTAAREVFSSISNIKRMGVEPQKQDYLVLSRGNFEILVRKLLLVKRYRVEIYIADGTTRNKEWVLKYKGSPGYLSQLEEVLGDGLGTNEDATATSLMAVTIKTDPVAKGRLLGVACVATGEYQLSLAEFTDDDLLTELEALTVQLAPAECLIPHSEHDDYKAVKKVMERANITVTKCKKVDFSTEGIIQDLNRLLKFKDDQQKDANVFPETRMEAAMNSLTGAVKYLELLSLPSNFGRYRITTIEAECFLHIDAAAMTALNVFPELGDTSNAPSRSIYGLLDRCRTAHGKRLLAQWLRQPLRDVNLIDERLDIVEVMIEKSQIRLQLHEDHLRRIPDLQVLARRLNRKKANLQDCYKIYQAIRRLPALLRCLAETDNSTVHSSLTEPISELNDDLSKFLEMIETTIDMEAVERGDFLVKASFDEQLQSLNERLNEMQSAAERELKRAARELNLEAGKGIKLESNPQNGFYFRVTMKEEQSLRGNKKFTIIDAVKGGVKFQNNALVSTNDEYLQCKATYEKEQDKVVTEIVSVAAGYSECLFCLSYILSKLDVLISYAIAACSAPYPYCRPKVVESIEEFILEEARHPCLELQEGVSYIANDVVFKRGECIMHIVTGANMGGKSTWMRSAGAIVLLAHAGCPVPCARAVVPRLRAICARVGATDREQRGQSTFMMEMLESAAILRTATPDSLVLVDELGRGTSTYEGCGLAWAIAEELALKCRCFCCFATHYHELTRLPLAHPGVIVNSHAEAAVVNGDLVLLHRVVPGPAAHSLGLHVAKLADLPLSVLQDTDCAAQTPVFSGECPAKCKTPLSDSGNLQTKTTTAQVPSCSNASTEKEKLLSSKCQKYINKICQLQQRVKELKRKNMLSELEKLSKKLTPSFAILLQAQIRNFNKKKSTGRRWSKDEKIIALRLFKRSPACYRLLQKLFNLPAPSTLKNMLSKVSMGVGANQPVFEVLKKFVETQIPSDNEYILMFDEMSIKKHLNYNRKEDLIEGYQDHGSQERSRVLAEYALVFMIAGIRKKIKQPIAHYFSSQYVTADRLAVLIKEYAESTQAMLETNLFDQSANNDADAGKKIVIEFLQQCKEVQKNTSSKEILFQKIQALKENLRQCNNVYVRQLLAEMEI